jgi:5'-3' exoribonuclease 2
MGVPAFYRWVSEKYSKIVIDILEKRAMLINGTIIPVNLTEPNPNHYEFDNLYIDMNGLIHPCSHPEDREAPTTEEEMYINVTYYLDRLVAAVRPRNLLYLAIDGVAPRAKMNQQRSRRFRSAQEVKEKKQMKVQVLEEMASLGYDIPAEEEDHNSWDSNVITPGTEFMTKISVFIRFYVLEKMNSDKYWKGLKVIISDASVAGEGEHKIMDFIRSQRSQPNYNPNLHHVIHGLDADLIMLALATHEIHFSILREKVFFGKRDKDQEKSEAQKLFENQEMHYPVAENPAVDWVYNKPLEALHVFVLREYLENEFRSLSTVLPFEYDLERVIDDFIFLCFFVGNDFLPHLPSLDIRDGALDFLIECYKNVLPTLGNYLTSMGGKLNLFQVDVLLSKVGEIEDQIFLRRKTAEDQNEKKMQERNAFRRPPSSSTGPSHSRFSQPVQIQEAQQSKITPVQNQAAASKIRDTLLGKRSRGTEENLQPSEKFPKIEDDQNLNLPQPIQTINTKENEHLLVDSTKIETETVDSESPDVIVNEIVKELPVELAPLQDEFKKRVKSREQEMIDTHKVTIHDPVRFHEVGWKDRYYQDPFKKQNIENGGGFRRMCYSYVQGLCWVLQYYYQGVPSWNWYYPFHYAPFASDLVNIDSYGEIEFDKSHPFTPIEQLLAVLPSSSAAALPEECRWLMLDKTSPIIDLYDENIPIDPNGKYLPWLWILLLPFIDETRIVEAFKMCKPNLSLDSLTKNSPGKVVIFVEENSSVGEFAKVQFTSSAPESDPDILNYLKMNNLLTGETKPVLSVGNDSLEYSEYNFGGNLSRPPLKWHCPLNSVVAAPEGSHRWFQSFENSRIVCFEYSIPTSNHVHQSVILPGAVRKPSVLSAYDLTPRRPPRLNKFGFNILDILTGYKEQQSYFRSNNSQNFTTNLPRPNYAGQSQQPQYHQQQNYQQYPPQYQRDSHYQQQHPPQRMQSYPPRQQSNSYPSQRQDTGYHSGSYNNRGNRSDETNLHHRVENLHSNDKSVSHNVGRNVTSRSSKTVFVSTLPPQNSNSQGGNQQVNSMQSMRDQLLQTINRKK